MMIIVPFDTEPHDIATHKQLSNKELDAVLDNAYNTMEWFRYLSDHATKVEVVKTIYKPPEHLTTTVFGFHLDPKHETYYRLKYGS